MFDFSIRRATEDDCADLFAWRDDPVTRRLSKNPDPLDWGTHVTWFAAALASADRTIYIGCNGREKIGSLRLDRMPADHLTLLASIVIAPARRGQGLGAILLREGVKRHRDAVINAEIATGNIVSRKIFESCGFTQLLRSTETAFDVFQRSANA